jgi:hypothetical protein
MVAGKKETLLLYSTWKRLIKYIVIVELSVYLSMVHQLTQSMG